MTIMKITEQLEYQNTIIRPLREAIEKAGGTNVVAHKARISQARLKKILLQNNTMNIITLMKLCSALNIYLVFMNMSYQEGQFAYIPNQDDSKD